MKKWDIFVLALHAFAYMLWYWDSKTVEAWKTKRRYWAEFEENEKYADAFMEDIYNYIDLHEDAHRAEREKQKKAAMDRHPTSYAADNETIANLAKKKQPRTPRPNNDFWPFFNDWDK